MKELTLHFKKKKRLFASLFWSFLKGFVVIFRFSYGRLDNFKFLNIIKKDSYWRSPRPPRNSSGLCKTVRWPKSCFHNGVGSGASSSSWWCAACSQRRSGWATVEVFSFFSLSLSSSRKTRLNFQKTIVSSGL